MNILFLMLCLNFKTALARRAAFLIRLFFVLINHSIVFLAWFFFFRAVPIVHHWNFYHLMLAYSLAWFAWGFVSFFAYGFRMLPRTIEFGELDHFLLQPRPLLLILAANNGEVFGVPDMILAAALIIYAGIKLQVTWSIVLFVIISASVIFTAFTLIIGSLAFWLNDMHDFLNDAQYNFFIFATRPTSAFHGWIKFIMFTFIPMGFISFLPVEIIRLADPEFILAQLVGTGIAVCLSLIIFNRGLKNYESGNRFGVRN